MADEMGNLGYYVIRK